MARRIALSLSVGAVLTLGLFLLLAGVQRPAGAATIKRYVSPTGHDTGSCSSISGRCRTIQYAVGKANPSDVIWLAHGTYTATGASVVSIDKSLTLIGGWDGIHAGHRDPLAHPTTIDGQGARQGLHISGPISATLEGFTITNGVTDTYGAGLYARDVTLTLRAMSFYSNVIDTTVVSDALGGGAMVEGGALWVEGCTFRYNSAQSESGPSGGGLAISGTLQATVENTLFQANDAWHASGLRWGDGPAGSTLAVRRCRFQDNGQGLSPGTASGGYGGAAEAFGGSVRIEDSSFVDNRASNGNGALWLGSGEVILERNVIARNESHTYESALYLYHLSPFTLTNNLIVDNLSTYDWTQHQAVGIVGGRGCLLHNTIARNGNTYGLRLTENAIVTLTNSIVVSHTVGITVGAGSWVWHDGILWGGSLWRNLTRTAGPGNVVKGPVQFLEDPVFLAPDRGDYRITTRSPGVDDALDLGVTDDVDGRNRPRDGDHDGVAEPDIGASEAYELFHLPAVLKSG